MCLEICPPQGATCLFWLDVVIVVRLWAALRLAAGPSREQELRAGCCSASLLVLLPGLRLFTMLSFNSGCICQLPRFLQHSPGVCVLAPRAATTYFRLPWAVATTRKWPSTCSFPHEDHNFASVHSLKNCTRRGRTYSVCDGLVFPHILPSILHLVPLLKALSNAWTPFVVRLLKEVVSQ